MGLPTNYIIVLVFLLIVHINIGTCFFLLREGEGWLRFNIFVYLKFSFKTKLKLRAVCFQCKGPATLILNDNFILKPRFSGYHGKVWF